MPGSYGPVELCPTPDMIVPPVFRHFVDLEKNNKYCTMLLRVRETEIERCTKAYEDLQATLKCCLGTNSKLKDRIELLEQMLSDGDENKRKDIESYRKQMAGLTKNLAETKRNTETKIQELENEFKRKLLETDKMYIDKLNRQEIEFDQKMDETGVKLQRETVLNSKLKSDLESIMAVNVDLKNKNQLLQYKHASEKTLLEIELSEQKDISKKTNGELIRLRRELERTTEQNKKFKQMMVEYQSKLQRDMVRTDEMSRINKTCKRVNNRLNCDLWECKQRNKELKQRIQSLIEEEGRLKEELEKLRILCNAKSTHARCNIPEHGNYDQVIQQNALLQEIVKTMRRDRSNKDNEDLRLAEDRIEKLEDAIEDFKNSDIFKSISIDASGHGDK